MIELRVVGSSDDYSYLLLSDKPRARRGSHLVAIDRELMEVLQAAVYARRDGARRSRIEDAPESAPTSLGAPKVAPREIQRLLRAGMSVEKVANVLDCEVALVERFETPIVYERNGVIADVQRFFIEKPRLGISGLGLRDAIETNLASRRIRLTDEAYLDGWNATREEGQPWKISFTFDFRGKQIAKFDFDPRTGRVSAANKAAMDIGWVPEGTVKPNMPPPMPGGKKRRPSNGKVTSKRSATSKKSAPKRKSPSRKPAARKPAAKKKPVSKKKPAARKPATRKPAAKRKPAARKTAAKKKPAARKTSARKPPARKSAAKRKPAARKPAARKSKQAASRRRTSR